MPNSKHFEGFVILDEENIPPEILNEIKYYNGLVKTLEKSTIQQLHILDIIRSENRLAKLFKQYPGIYPLKVAYGFMPLIELLKDKNIDPSQFIEKLKQTKTLFGEDYLKALLLFETSELINLKPAWGWASGDLDSVLNGSQNNLFMIAVSTGNQKLVQLILDLFPDPEIKKRLLLQLLQYFPGASEVKCKTILEIALETGSPEFIGFMISTLNDLGILKETATDIELFAGGTNGSATLLTKACETGSVEVVRIVLKARDKIGRALYIPRSESDKYPDYISANTLYLPVFVKAIQNCSSGQFNLILDATIQAIDFNPQDPQFYAKDLKLTQLSSSIAVIDLSLYMQHRDFDPQIFARVLNLKIQLHQEIDKLKYQKDALLGKMGLFQLERNGVNIHTLNRHNELWNLSLDYNADKPLELMYMLRNLFTFCVSVKNNHAATLVLVGIFNNQIKDEVTDLLKNQPEKLQIKLKQSLFIEAINTSNTGLIYYLTKNNVKVTTETIQVLCKITDPNLFIHMTRELFHSIHENKLTYKEQHLKIVLEKIKSVVATHRDLKEPINLLIDEIEQNKHSMKTDFISKFTHKGEINKLISQIKDSNNLPLLLNSKRS